MSNTINIKFFASVREKLGTSEMQFDLSRLPENPSAKDVWQAVSNQSDLSNIYCAINHKHADLHQIVKANDEVGFFPPLTGG